jgi:hypothetical protein
MSNAYLELEGILVQVGTFTFLVSQVLLDRWQSLFARCYMNHVKTCETSQSSRRQRLLVGDLTLGLHRRASYLISSPAGIGRM